jgi:hypothetical protein
VIFVFRLLLQSLCVGLLVVAGGCTTVKKMTPFKSHTPRAELVHPAPERVGVIVLVNGETRFVLIDTSTGVIPDPGTALKALRQDAQVAVLKCGDVQRRPFVIADIVSGEPARGDVVFR